MSARAIATLVCSVGDEGELVVRLDGAIPSALAEGLLQRLDQVIERLMESGVALDDVAESVRFSDAIAVSLKYLA